MGLCTSVGFGTTNWGELAWHFNSMAVTLKETNRR